MSVRTFTDGELLKRVAILATFTHYPSNFWLIGIRSKADLFDRFDDKLYLFKGENFIGVWKCTTNAGTDMLNPTNSRGEAVLQSDNIFYDSHERRLHRGKVMAYCQRVPLPICRDNDCDKLTEELTAPTMENVGINIHPNSYQAGTGEKTLIGLWSQGCTVFSSRIDFDEFMQLTNGQTRISYALLKEF